jgi:uncharacterized protein (TIGR02246 family)
MEQPMHNRATCLTDLTAGIAVSALTLLGAAAILPADAQQAGTLSPRPQAASPAPDRQDPMAIAAALNVRRSRLYQQQDTAGVASLYSQDATYVELMPVLQVLKGRDQIKGHFEELISASAVNIVPTVTRAERNADGTILASGDYLVLSWEGTQTERHFVQTLRQEDGTWRIAVHVFARPDPVTAAERERYPRD